MMKLILASAAMAVLAAPALAQTPSQPANPPATEDKFTKHDANADGELSLAEVKTADATATEDEFDKYDTDKDQGLSKTEFAKWVEAKTTPPASAPG